MLMASDEYSERVYDLIDKRKDEPTRLELWRTAYLAVQYKAQQLERKRIQRAIERRAEERRGMQQLGGGDGSR